MKKLFLLLFLAAGPAVAEGDMPPATARVPDVVLDKTALFAAAAKMNCPNGFIINESAVFVSRDGKSVTLGRGALQCNPIPSGPRP